MKVKCLGVVLSLFFLLCIAQNSLAQTWVYANDNLKIENLASTSEGLEFKLRENSHTVLAPNSSCDNEFIIPRGHLDYDMLAAFMLTALARNMKIGIYYDDDSVECKVEVNSVIVY